MVLGTNR